MPSVGITYRSSTPLYTGMNMTAIQLMEIYTGLGYHVVMMDVDNVEPVVPPSFKNKAQWALAYRTQGLDRLIDIDATQTHADRVKMASQSIVFLRSFLQFSELEQSAYMEIPYRPRDLEGVYEIWCWDIMNPAETLPSIELLFPCPIRRMPFAWSSTVIRHLYETSECKHNSSFADKVPWTIHVAEKNVANQSNSVLPMVAIKELCDQHVMDAQYHIHGMDHIKENRFLKENVLVNIQSHTLPLQMISDTSYQKWLEMPNQVLFSHIRFQPVRLAVLNAIWLGIPLIHNSPALRDAHPILRSLYYTGNNIHAIVDTFKYFLADPSTRWYSHQESMRSWVEEEYSWKKSEDQWKDAISLVLAPEKEVSYPVLSNEAPTLPEVSEIVISFSDMWPGFNADQNYLLDALRHEYPSFIIKGVSYHSDTPSHLLIFGPYSENWKSIPSTIPKVYFSAENWSQPDDSSITCYLTPSRKEDERHKRVATWATFIDWFSESKTLPSDTTLDNPIRLPIHFAINPHENVWSDRKEFCAFVVSNPVCDFRNQTFQAVNEYKHVNSGGSLFNNIGGQLSLKYPGGGCGDISKHRFFSDHKYTISFENSQAHGYVTEKLLHAKMAGCVPLYWGDMDASQDFVPESFVNLSAVKDPAMVVQILKKLEANPAMCQKMAATPLLNEEKRKKALHDMSMVSKHLMKIICEKVKPITKQVKPMTEKVISCAPKGIHSTYVINLDTRMDRWESLIRSEPWIKEYAERTSAVNGRTLQLTPVIYELFEHNNFNWKKSVIGCSLSHIKLWSKIAAAEWLQPDDKILILEDDVRFMNGWRQHWNLAADTIPDDADLLYLGGVLPPNKTALPHVLEKVNDNWSMIRPNTLFTTVEAPVFHFCAYSYILTPRGAQKLIVGLMESHDKAAIAIDHVLGHPRYGLKTYISSPLLTGCFQEEDPAYVQSNFNQIDRKDQFDSDIWNNVETFTDTDLTPFRVKTMTIYYRETPDHPFDLYERKWLEYVTQRQIVCKPFCMDAEPPEENGWYVVQRPYSKEWSDLFHKWNEKGISFRVLHLSDEFLSDEVDFYSLPSCKGVIRNYVRQDIPSLPYIITIPLGYHHSPQENASPQNTWNQRSLMWSFHGTDWFQRSKQLNAFESFVPNHCRLLPTWNDPHMTSEHDYLKLLQDTKFCPILKGNHYETFRLYEALESGCLPITTITDLNYLSWVDDHLHIEELYAWNKPCDVMQNETLIGEQTRMAVQLRWNQWKEQIRAECQKLL